MGKSCLNCARRKPFYDGTIRTGHVCSLDPEMHVNGRMCCEEWLSGGPFAVGISNIGHVKYSINGKGTQRGK